MTDQPLRLVLIRHAKSDWPYEVDDHQRPLSERGLRDAGAVGVWLLAHDLVPDHVYVSTATRAQETWGLASLELGVPVSRSDEHRVYAASAGRLIEVIRETPETVRTVALVGHNPGIEYAALVLDDGLGDEARRRHLALKYPTSGVAVLQVHGPRWTDVEPEACRLIDFVAPRG